VPQPPAPRGRGAASNPANRFERLHLEPDAEALAGSGTGDAPVPTEYFRDGARSVISRNDSPDIPFDASLNPYRGCEHGCIYCYARPYHEYLGLSAGLDFETRIFVKEDAPELLRRELASRSWVPQALALSGVTDPYQPVERRLQLTRRCLAVLASCRHPVGVVTKSPLVTRDVDLLRELASVGAAQVSVSIPTADEALRRVMEPRAATAEARFTALARLREAGIPAGVLVSPVIPGLTDHEVPRVLRLAADAGASFAGYTLVRLPHAVGPLFDAWLARHFPDRRERVLSRVRDVRGGRLHDARFGVRMRGTGILAEFTAELFRTTRGRAGIAEASPPLSAAAFRRPGSQPGLFDEAVPGACVGGLARLGVEAGG